MKNLFVTILFAFSFLATEAKTIIIKAGDGGGPTIYTLDAMAKWHLKPGDTLILAVSLEQLMLGGLQGTPDSPIVVKFAPGVKVGKTGLAPAIARNIETPNAYAVNFDTIVVNGHDNDRMGWKMQFASFIRINGYWCDSTGDGISIKADPDTTNPATCYPQVILRNFDIRNVFINQTRNEGVYFGHTMTLDGGSRTPGKQPAPIYGAYMYNINVRKSGWDGFQLTNGANMVIDSVRLDSSGWTNQPAQTTGATFQDVLIGGFYYRIYSNWSAAQGFQVFGQGMMRFKDIYIDTPSALNNTQGMLWDNRDAHGYPFSYARKIYLTNLRLRGGSGQYALRMQQSTDNGKIASLPGKVVNFTVDNTANWTLGTQGLQNDQGNLLYTGTYGVPYTPGGIIETPKIYMSMRQDILKVGTPDTMDLVTPPAAPMFFYAKNKNGYVHLNWEPSLRDGGSPITGYKIYKSTSSGGSTVLTTVSPSTTGYDDFSVSAGSTYYYNITAVTSRFESYNPGNRINEYKITYSIPAAPPTPTTSDAVTNLSGINGNGFVTLSWDYPANDGNGDIFNFKLYKGTTSGGETFVSDLGYTFSYTDSAVINETQYYYKIAPQNVAGVGTISSSLPLKPTAFLPPSAPLSVAATPAGSQTINITWAAPASDGGTAVTTYKVYRSTNSTSGFNSLGNLSGSTFLKVDGSKVSGTTYYYKVTASNAAGEGPYSATVSAVAP